MTAGNWRCLLNYPWQVTICQRQSHGMTVVSLCCMPLDNCPFQIFNYRWQGINGQLLGAQVDADLPVWPPPPQPTTPGWRIKYMNIFATKTKSRKIKIITSASVIEKTKATKQKRSRDGLRWHTQKRKAGSWPPVEKREAGYINKSWAKGPRDGPKAHSTALRRS